MKTTSKRFFSNEDDLKKNHLFLIPLKFRGKPFLGLAQLSKIFLFTICTQVAISTSYCGALYKYLKIKIEGNELKNILDIFFYSERMKTIKKKYCS
jgi:hypothetical protein